MAGGERGAGGSPLGFAAGSRIAGYRLQEQIGAGGMAVVFRALDERLDRLVALKLLAHWLASDAAFRHRFLRESRAAAAVDDPHIIPVYEAGEADGVLFIAMRYVSGGDVRDLLEREGPLVPARAAAVISPLASALDAAHAAGLVHRDVKPANMLVDARPGRPDHVYLSDFGLAKGKLPSARLTASGQYLGTVAYMAPEQIEGRAVDGRTDQYALACAAFELLSGAVPFERDQDMAVIYAHLSQPPPSLTSRRPGLPPAADDVIARAMAKAPDDRYPSCTAFADAMRAALGLAAYDQRPGTAQAGPGGAPLSQAAEATRIAPAAPLAPAVPAAARPSASPPARAAPAGTRARPGGPGTPSSLRSRALQLTSFIGRADAVDEVVGLLDDSRLVTVTGPGGVGKTRLAAEVATRVAERFADGTWLVELAAVQDPTLVPDAVVAALGLPQTPTMSAEEYLVSTLARGQLLLVLDNCEHLVDAAAELCETLLAAADDVRILATSQEPLRVTGEARYRLPPLPVPKPGEAAESDAVRLFVDRARRADPHFSLDPESSKTVAALVARLDGMPLAIELAAARVEALGLDQLHDRLGDRFSLLAGGSRGAAPRQRSLAATVDWSYRLLSEEEQRVFRQLSVFPGPFTLEAAEAIAGDAVAPAVLHLVDCSLVSPPRTGPDGRARYLLLETLRAFGAGRLAESGEDQAAAASLAGYALRVAEQAAAGMETSVGEPAATRWLDAEDATMQQALSWALEHEPPGALRLGTALAPWWVLRGRVASGYSLLNAAAERTSQANPAWPAAQYWLGYTANLTSEFTTALGHYTAVLDAPTDEPRSRLRADALSGRSNCLLNLGRTQEAAEDAMRALSIAQEIAYLAGEARALMSLSFMAQYTGGDEDALRWARQATQIDPEAVPGRLVRQINNSMADALISAGDLASAERSAVAELGRARQAGDLLSQSFCLDMLAELDQRAGRIPESADHLREAIEISVRIDNGLRLTDCFNSCGHLCAATQRWADAVTMWAAYASSLKRLGLADLPDAEERRREPMRKAEQALGPDRTRAAQERGTGMTLTTAAELAIILTRRESRAPRDLAQLSPEEQELVTLVARGRTNAEIAEQLGIGVGAVRHRLDQIRAKAGCPRRADLIGFALQAGLI
jgi:predicted ATPase/DNA-binding CsgD family transcriptional regulator